MATKKQLMNLAKARAVRMANIQNRRSFPQKRNTLTFPRRTIANSDLITIPDTQITDKEIFRDRMFFSNGNDQFLENESLWIGVGDWFDEQFIPNKRIATPAEIERIKRKVRQQK
jgi:acid phosphatase class B